MAITDRIKNRVHRLDELVNDLRLGIRTIEYHSQHDTERPDFRGYSPTTYRDWHIMRQHLSPRGSFIDYGAGLGRVTVLAARLPFRRVIGLDLDQDLVDRGNQNLRAARGLKCRAEIVCQDATAFQIPNDASVLYFCNPFSGKVLASVLDNVREARGRPAMVCNLPSESGFEHEIRAVSWLALQAQIALSDGRKCLVFRARRPDLS